MSETWRVLMIEDSPSDAKLILAELRRSGHAIECQRVEDEAALRTCLGEGKWDVVLSDWSLPVFSAPLALALMKELEADIPFIIVSGTVGEEMAVEAMRAGASDYVLKDRIARLAPAIERELRERRAKRSAAQALQRSEEQLRQAQKMEAVGRLAAGVAHDFNNLLSVILGYAELLVAKLQQDDIRRDIQEIESAATRAAELTRQLLLFSRQQVLAPAVIDLNLLLSSLERMLIRVLGEDVEFSLALGEALGRVRGDRASLEQAVMNLVVNARDAMPNGGRLTIETSEQLLDEEYARGHLGVRPGPYVSLVVTDTGIGMDAETQARMFEPFFTTKDKNTGTGLGLSMVLGIVQQSGGSIWVYSELGVGTSFKIFLPCVTEEATVERQAQAVRHSLTGTETILLVEDEAQVRTVASRILRTYGYQVIEASTASEAVLVCNSHPTAIDLLVTDVVMPKISGPELALQLSRIRPEMLVLYMSGYTDHTALQHGLLREDVAYLQKPITPTSLATKVRDVFERRVGSRRDKE
jgi:two-component system cell cycle sensor histidine kinase/response regulator CckA